MVVFAALMTFQGHSTLVKVKLVHDKEVHQLAISAPFFLVFLERGTLQPLCVGASCEVAYVMENKDNDTPSFNVRSKADRSQFLSLA